MKNINDLDFESMYNAYIEQYEKSERYAKKKGGRAAEMKLSKARFKTAVISELDYKDKKTSFKRFSQDIARAQVITKGKEEAKKLMASIEGSNAYFQGIVEELVGSGARKEEIEKTKRMIIDVPKLVDIRFGKFEEQGERELKAKRDAWWEEFKKNNPNIKGKAAKQEFSRVWFTAYGY